MSGDDGRLPPLLVEDLNISYGSLRAVDGVSFTARRGEVTVVVGPNGAGKTSTIEACEGFRRPDRGTIRVLGHDPARHQGELRARVGVMLQEDGIYPAAQVRETIAQYCAIYQRGVDPSTLMATVGLEGQARQRWKQLSGGQKQRLSLALALAARPEVAFLDEPTSGVDLEGRDVIRRLVRDLADEGGAVVLATHELHEAERIADRVIIFDQGRVAADGSLDELRSGRPHIRFQTGAAIDQAALAAMLGLAVHPQTAGADTSASDGHASERTPWEYLIEAAPDADLMARTTGWLAQHGIELVSIEAGSENLESVFRRVTGSDGRPQAPSNAQSLPNTGELA